MSSLQVGRAIYTLLKGFNAYPLVADEGATYPFIIYKRTGLVPASTKDMYNYRELATVELVVASDKYNESIEVAENIKSILEHTRGMYDDIKIGDITLVGASEAYIDNAFIQNLIFNIEII